MKLYIKNTQNFTLPTQAHPKEDACFDIYAASEPIIKGEYIERMDGVKLYKNILYIEYITNLQFQPKEGYHIKIYPRSSITNKNLTLKNSVAIIDEGFRNIVMLRYLYQPQPEDYEIIPEAGGLKMYININKDLIYNENDRIAQFEICKTIPVDLVLKNELLDSSRKMGGLGSSGN